jgi:hypothetical protein
MLAREKYRGASYFYTQMSKASDEPDAFRHNLSAFLSAFRSVTLYLQAESSSDPRFGSWYEEKRNKMRGDPILRLLNEQRRVTVHERPARVIGKFTVYVADPTMAIAEALKEGGWLGLESARGNPESLFMCPSRQCLIS